MKTHTCPGGCNAQVPQRRFACPPCWFRLPCYLRDPIRASHNTRDRATHWQAMREAIQWYRNNPRKDVQAA